MRIHQFAVTRFALTCLAAGAVLISGVSADSNTAAGPGVSIDGQVDATDIFGGLFPKAATFSLNARTDRHGDASGRFNMVARGDFAAAWGACPYDPRCEDYPNTSTKTYTLKGDVTSIVALGATVEVSGTLTETDHGKRNGVIFEEFDVPFVITATEGSEEFVLQFCEVPPFTMNLAKGHVKVQAGAPTALFNRPQPVTTGLACR